MREAGLVGGLKAGCELPSVMASTPTMAAATAIANLNERGDLITLSRGAPAHAHWVRSLRRQFVLAHHIRHIDRVGRSIRSRADALPDKEACNSHHDYNSDGGEN